MKNRIIAALAITFLAVLTTSSAREASAQAPGSGFEPTYGEAGCGLGSMLIGSKPGIVQVFAATTNGFLGTQTFGITSGTSNCGSSGGAVASTKNFVETNRAVVAKDIARGQGETIATLSTLAGCGDSHMVGSSLQRNFKRIFPDSAIGDRDVARNVVSVLKSDGALSCRKL
ncbi:MAG TPA: DUF3015 family protein [Kofleriaceae bacterium]|nr:DUF3015 family protein [Kofleriaceae bacterium]